VIRGERDALCPPVWVDEVVRLLPNAHAATVPGRGHETMISGYREVARAIAAHLGTEERDEGAGAR